MIRKVAFAHKKEKRAIIAAAKARAKHARMFAREQQRAERETEKALRFAENRSSKKRKLENGTAAAAGSGDGSRLGSGSPTAYYAAPPPSMYHSYELPSAFGGPAPGMELYAFVGDFGNVGGGVGAAQAVVLEACNPADAVRYVRSPGGGLSVASGAVTAAAASAAAAPQFAEGEATESDEGEETQSD